MPLKKSRQRRELAGTAAATPNTKATGARKRPAPSPAASPQAAPPSVARTPRRSPRADAALKKKLWLDELLSAAHNSHVLLLDLDNWPTFFAGMPWESLPPNVYLAACYRAETFAKAAHEKQLHNKCTAAMLRDHRLLFVPSLSSKDSADSEIIALAKVVEHVVKQRDGLSRLWISIISGDHIFKQTQETMSRSLPIMTCSERDHVHLGVLLAATGTCTLSQLQPAPRLGCGREHEQQRQKRARVHRTSNCMASTNPPAIHVDASEKPALTTLGPLTMSSIQFNIGMHGSTVGTAHAGGLGGKGRGRGQHKRRETSKVTLGACIGAAVLQSTRGKPFDRQQDNRVPKPQCNDWPALPTPSPVKLTFAQALKGIAVAKPAQASPADAGARTGQERVEGRPLAAGVFRFGQKGVSTTQPSAVQTTLH